MHDVKVEYVLYKSIVCIILRYNMYYIKV